MSKPRSVKQDPSAGADGEPEARSGDQHNPDTRDELIHAMAETSPAMLWMGDENAKCVFLNRALRNFWGVDPKDLSSFDWSDTIHPDDVEKLAVPFAAAMQKQTSFEVEARYRRADGAYRTLLTQANPRFHSRTGQFLGMTGVNTDITDRLAAEDHTRMLMGELNHRTKNILAVVQAVARQSAKHSSLDDFHTIFKERIAGLAASNDLLLRNAWAGVDMADLINSQLTHLKDFLGNRIVVSGPAVTITATAAQTLGMAFHELSTNSLKYGALSCAAGQVSIAWAFDDPAGRLRISWRETGCGPAHAPDHKGFGHLVIVDMVESALDAQVETTFGEAGYTWCATARSNRALLA